VGGKSRKIPKWLAGVYLVRGPIVFVCGFGVALLGELIFESFNSDLAVTIGWIGWFVSAVGLIDFIICLFSKVFGSTGSA
jgi:hypothetical protein